jgi:hypothetical protein
MPAGPMEARSGYRVLPFSRPIADTIQELKVQSHNNDVQYANVLGAAVNIITKSGTNAFHGSAWEFARNPFTGFCTAALCSTLANQLNGQVASGARTAVGAAAILSGTPVSPIGYSQHEFGGTFGGRVTFGAILGAKVWRREFAHSTFPKSLR